MMFPLFGLPGPPLPSASAVDPAGWPVLAAAVAVAVAVAVCKLKPQNGSDRSRLDQVTTTRHLTTKPGCSPGKVLLLRCCPSYDLETGDGLAIAGGDNGKVRRGKKKTLECSTRFRGKSPGTLFCFIFFLFFKNRIMLIKFTLLYPPSRMTFRSVRIRNPPAVEDSRPNGEPARLGDEYAICVSEFDALLTSQAPSFWS